MARKTTTNDYLTDLENSYLKLLDKARNDKAVRDAVCIRASLKTILALPPNLDEETLTKLLNQTELVIYRALHSEQFETKPIDSIKTVSSLLGEDKLVVQHELGADTDMFLGIHRESVVPYKDEDSDD